LFRALKPDNSRATKPGQITRYLQGVAGLFAAKALVRHAALARKLFAVLIILVAAYVAYRALAG